ncbi:MAG: hypothetical protein AB7N80_15070 [Bdellovibrionales bacterium]
MRILIFFMITCSVSAWAGLSIKSKPTKIAVMPTAGTSALAQLAASMTSGELKTFTMGGMNMALLDSGGGHSITEFSARGHWDPVHKKIVYWGQGHYASSKLITWDDASNQWSADNTAVFGGIGHAYYHLALNPSNGDLYLRAYAATEVKKKPFGQAWNSIANFSNIASQVAGGLEWFPALNAGMGGLVFIDALGAQTWNPSTNTWTTRSSNLSGLGPYHNWIATAGENLYFGGGNGSTTMYRLDKSGAVTSAPNTPLQAGVWATGLSPVISHPDKKQLLLFSFGSTGTVHKFDGNSWSVNSSHQLNAGDWIFAVPVSDYGVVLFITQSTSVSNPVVKVYKP